MKIATERGQPGWPIYCSSCRALAFLIAKPVHDGDCLDGDTVVRPDGSRVFDGDAISCPACLMHFSSVDLDRGLI